MTTEPEYYLALARVKDLVYDPAIDDYCLDQTAWDAETVVSGPRPLLALIAGLVNAFLSQQIAAIFPVDTDPAGTFDEVSHDYTELADEDFEAAIAYLRAERQRWDAEHGRPQEAE